MRPLSKLRLKFALVTVLMVVGVGFALTRFRSFRNAGPENARVWFYDQSEKRLYAAASDVVPPNKGVGGKSDDGVRAVVIAFRGEQADPRKQRIAYLETYTPELKALLEQVRAARASGKPFAGRIPSRDSDYFQANTLVKSTDDDEWHPISSVAGQKILAAWRAWRGTDGQGPIVCAP